MARTCTTFLTIPLRMNSSSTPPDVTVGSNCTTVIGTEVVVPKSPGYPPMADNPDKQKYLKRSKSFRAGDGTPDDIADGSVDTTPTILQRGRTIPSAPSRETKKFKSGPELVDLSKPELYDLTSDDEESTSLEGVVKVIDLTNEELEVPELVTKLEATMDELDKVEAVVDEILKDTEYANFK